MRVPRFTSRGLATAAAIIAVGGLVASCTSGGSQNAQQAKEQTTAVAPTTTSASLSPLPSSPKVTAATPEVAAKFASIKTMVAHTVTPTPVSRDLNGTVNIEGYLQAVMYSNKMVWFPIFQSVGLSTPRFAFDVTSRSDRYISACQHGSEKIVVTASYGKFFYCSADSQPYGAIALPSDVVAPLWKKAARPVADLAAAISTSRQAALILVDSLQWQLKLPQPHDTSRQYMAACLAGVWAHAVYPQDVLDLRGLSSAISWSFTIPSEVDGVVTSPQPKDDDQAGRAWADGLRSGDLSECGQRFWN